ncbi:TRPC1 [Cordylochernes scorpioides]|uniref:TRPC1 n=1 Tax=Cordylochernes scorpioides TaxID=51811 RepID=A0ABY6L5U4_9ARAC|nr:TRPC1 [Cordylochernes scorpioides]
MRRLVRRYVTFQQKRQEETGVTEDDVNEIKQKISSLRSEVLDVFRSNGMMTSKNSSFEKDLLVGRKERIKERRILKDFNIELAEDPILEKAKEPYLKDSKRISFRRLTRRGKTSARSNWQWLMAASRAKQSQIGSAKFVRQKSVEAMREEIFGDKGHVDTTSSQVNGKSELPPSTNKKNEVVLNVISIDADSSEPNTLPQVKSEKSPAIKWTHRIGI